MTIARDGVCLAATNRRPHIAFARAGAIASQDSDGDHGAAEAEVEDDGEDRQARDTAEAACQEDGEGEVDDCRARDAFDGPGVLAHLRSVRFRVAGFM